MADHNDSIPATTATSGSAAITLGALTYREVVQNLANTPCDVFVNGDVCWVLEYPMTEDQKARVRAIAYADANCNACTSRAAKYVCLAGPDGPLFMQHADGAANPAFAQLRDLAVEICSNRKAMPVPVIVGPSTFAPMQEGSHSETGRLFKHWTVCPAATTPRQLSKLLKLAIHTYVRTNSDGPQMLTALVARILESPEMVESLQLFSTCLDKAHRGAIYRGSTDWLLAIQAEADGQIWSRMTPIEQIRIVMFALGTARVAPGVSRGSATITMYHQANNSIMGFLENAHNEKAMVALINAQSDPHAYQRRMAAPSAGQIAAAMAKIGPDFKNTVALASELPELYPDQAIVWDAPPEDAPHTSGTGFAAMQASVASSSSASRSKRERAGGFASRSRTARGITTVEDLKAILRDGQPHELYIDAANHSPWVVAHCTKPDILRDCQNHVWACWNGGRLGSGWVESGTDAHRMPVTSAFCMPMGELLFVCKGAKPKASLGNFCFPAFLRPEYHDCKQAFEQLNKVTTVEVPELPIGDQYAVGVCACPTTASRSLLRGMTIWLDGQKHILTSME